jgi:class 3 adenylate cyclase/ligand-binding sensor domain-containing protein
MKFKFHSYVNSINTYLLFILSLWILNITICFPQPQKLIFRHLEEKFPFIEPPEEPLYEDSQGFIWWTGNTHLYKYDGYSVKSYSFKKICGIQDVNVSHTTVRFLEDRQGKFWISTNHLLFLYDHLTESFTRVTLNYTNSESLPTILCLYQDNKERIWVGTYYDILLHFPANIISDPIGSMVGSVPEIIIPPDSIEIFHMDSILNKDRKTRPYMSPVHNSIIQDKCGDIWIRTADCLTRFVENDSLSDRVFINYYYDRKETLIRYFPSTNGLFLDQDSTVWVYFYNRLFTFKEKPKNVFTPFKIIEKGTISPDRSKWWKTYVYDDYRNKLTSEKFISDKNVSEYQFDHPLQYWAIHQNDFWVIADNRIYLYNNSNEGNYNILKNIRQYNLSENDPYGVKNSLKYILISQERMLWCGDDTQGIINADLNYLQQFTKYRHIPNDHFSMPVPDNEINSMLKDHTGNMWLCNEDDLYITDEKFQLVRKITIRNNTSKIIEDQNGNLWLMGNRLFILNLPLFYNGSSLRTCLYALTNKNISSKGEWYIDMVIDQKGIIWITVFNDLFYADLNPFTGMNFDKIRSITFKEFAPLSDYGNDSILFKNFIVGQPGDNVRIQYVYDGSNNKTKWGFYDINIHSGELSRYFMDSVNIDAYGSIEMVMDDSSNLYLSNKISFYRVSFSLNKKGEYVVKNIKQFTEENGFTYSPTRLIFDNNWDLWFCDITENGLVRFNPINGNIKKFTGPEIISKPSMGKAFYKDRDGWMYFQSTDGISVFNPDSIKDHLFVPPIKITSVNINHESFLDQLDSGQITEFSTSNTFVLPYSQNTFSFTFSALSYANPDLNQYAYKLEGMDKEWIYVNANNRQAAYTSLSAGSYNFMVKGSNKDGIWNKTAASINLIILPPWWLTWLAKSVYVLLFIGTIRGFIYLKIRKHKRKLRDMQLINDAFSKFVPYEFLHAIGREYILDVRLGDKTYRDVTVLFLDIRDYTTLAESMSPDDNFAFIQKFVGMMGPIIIENKGFVNQYLGDGIMAIFPERVDDALKAAIDIQNELSTYNQRRISTKKKEIQIGVGLHSGPLIMGIIGDEKRRDPATIADTVNTASRLEGMTKFYGVKILISEESLLLLDSRQKFHTRCLGEVLVKGKNTPLKVFECLDADKEIIRNKKLARLIEFNDGLNLYLKKEFSEASVVFNHIVKDNQGDKAAVYYYNKAVTYALKGVPEDWTGIEKMKMK